MLNLAADGAEVCVLIDGDRITAIGSAADLPCPPAAERLEAGGLLLAPGFIDLQFNGAFGLDFTAEPGTIWQVGARLPRYGVTSFLPTIVTSPLATVAEAQSVLQAGPPPGYVGARPLGLHLEGPFLNPAKRVLIPDLRAGCSLAAQLASVPLDELGAHLAALAPEVPAS